MTAGPVGLLADIGGTHARFAVLEDGRIHSARSLKCADFDGPASAARAALAGRRADWGAFAVAAVVEGDDLDVVNSHWRFSLEQTRRDLGLERLDALNDFTAVALALPRLGPDGLLTIGGGQAALGAPMAALGPGTGLGMSALVPMDAGDWAALAGEGGNLTLAAANEREDRVLALLRRRFGHVSAEAILSGQGLVTLAEAVAELAGQGTDAATPALVASRGVEGRCPHCVEALDLFFAFLGTAAADFALSVGARGGVFLAGGILPRMAEAFRASGFRARFEDKGRFRPYLAAIPTSLIRDPLVALTGLAARFAPPPVS